MIFAHLAQLSLLTRHHSLNVVNRQIKDIAMKLSKAVALITLFSLSGLAMAGPTCTDEPQTKWLTEEQMTKKFQDMGFKDDVKKLHVSKGNCWEIYGHDNNNKKVEIYFHPITGAIVQATVKE